MTTPAFSIRIDKRDFSGPELLPGLTWAVERLEWRAVGGPWSARLRARGGNAARLWRLAELLRCPITILDNGGAAWWGYISAVELRQGARVVRASLDELANTAAVRYKSLSPDPWGGEEQSTGYHSAADSIRVYGERQRLYSLDRPAAQAEAEAFRAGLLARYSQPRLTCSSVEPGAGDGDDLIAVIEARGWWETLDWQFYADPRGWLRHTRLGGSALLGSSVALSRWAVSFNIGDGPGYLLPEAWLRVRRVGSPTDHLLAQICAGTGGVPGAVLAASQPVSGAALPDEPHWARFAFDPPCPLEANTPYFLVLSRSGAPDPVHHYAVSIDQSLGSPDSSTLTWNGVGWVPPEPDGDLLFALSGVENLYTQLERMLTGCGQFFTGIRIWQRPGVLGRVYRDGRSRGREEVEALLPICEPDGTRLLAKVASDRTVMIYRQASAEDARLLITPAGRIAMSNGHPLRPCEAFWLVGAWASLGDLASPSLRPAAVFIESCVWDGDGFRVGEE